MLRWVGIAYVKEGSLWPEIVMLSFTQLAKQIKINALYSDIKFVLIWSEMVIVDHLDKNVYAFEKLQIQ